jgi:arylsulfatase A-like enzyme
MLSDLLEGAGYETGMVTAIPMAEKAVGDRFQSVSVRYMAAEERVAAARDWMAGRDRWFCYLHLGDPHVPMNIPEDHRETFDVPSMAGINDWRFRETTNGAEFERYREARIRAYDAAIRGADDALGNLLADIDDETIVVVCGDHGEAFWEHPNLERQMNNDPRGYYATDHGHSVFEEVARVPLWMRAPGLDRTTSDRPVSLVDVAPTILRVLGAATPDGLDGRLLTESATADDRPILCEETAYGYNQRAVWRAGKKALTAPKTETTLAFELEEYVEGEPLETVPDELEEALASFGNGVEGADRMAVDDNTRARLEELGYLE